VGKQTRLLIVDDDPGMTETLADILSDMGHDVDIAGDGYRAIEMIETNAYEVVLMDVMMPGINGVETFKRVKHISPSMKFIMMTGYRQEVAELVEEAAKNGAYTCLYKPLDMNKVVAIVDEISRLKREGVFEKAR